MRGNGRREAALAVVSLVAALLLGEASLRLIDFSFDVAPRNVEFGAPSPKRIRMHKPDPDLFWVETDYAEKLADLERRRPGILFMGDSCTRFSSYPARLVRRLHMARPELRIDGEQLGFSGWTTYQGLRQLVRDVLPLRPKVVTFYYGWNDHWMGFGVEDDEIAAATTALRPIRDLRLTQLGFKAWLAWRGRDRDRWPVRVPPEDFRANLARMVRLARRHNIIPVLLTAPSGYEEGNEPQHLSRRWVHNLSDLVPLHRKYVDIVHEVAANEKAPLCDLADSFDALPPDEVRTRHFKVDGIHLTAQGSEKIADMLFDCFRNEGELRRLWDL